MAAKPGKHRLPPAERRRVIQAAAEGLLAERGFAATRLEDIAAAAGVSKQLLHRHFASKRELHLSLLAEHRDGIVAQISAMRREGDLEQRLRGTLHGWFGYVDDHPFAARLLFRDTTGDPEIVAFHVQMQSTARAATIAVLRDDPVVSLADDELEATAELVRSCTVGLALWWQDHPGVTRSWVVDLAAGFLLHGLAKPT